MLSKHIRPPVAAFLLALMTSVQAATADGTAAADVNVCLHVDGMIDGPHIPDETTARVVAAAIIAQLEFHGVYSPPHSHDLSNRHL